MLQCTSFGFYKFQDRCILLVTLVTGTYIILINESSLKVLEKKCLMKFTGIKLYFFILNSVNMYTHL